MKECPRNLFPTKIVLNKRERKMLRKRQGRKKMKKTMKIAAALFSAVMLTACAGGGNLLAGGDPDSSALTMYVYDGSVCKVNYLFDSKQTQTLLDEINALPAAETSAGALSGDIYAFSIGTGEYDVAGLWQDGVWISSAGAQYAVNADFAALTAGYDWQDGGEVSLCALPNIRALAQNGDSWNTAYLQQASEPVQSALTLEIADYDGTARAIITNTSDSEQAFGLAFSVEVCIDGVWYGVPAQNDLCFEEIAMLIAAGDSVERNYDVTYYGSLPQGEYRLRTDFAAAVLP